MKLDLNDKDVMRAMGIPFWPFAHWFGIEVNQADLDYIVNVIKKDKCFPFILSADTIDRAHNKKLSLLDRAYARINVIVFFDKFYNDPNCPQGVRLILFALSGLHRDYVAQNFPNLLSDRYHYVERWLETISNS